MDPPPNYLNLSKTSNQISQDEGFWRDKYWKDFGISESELMEGETWRERYKQRTIVGINSPISGRWGHYGIIDQKGILYMAGNNRFGQLGNGTTIDSIRPMAIPFTKRVIGISCERDYTAALTVDGKIYLWGDLSSLAQIDEFLTGNIEWTKSGHIKPILTPRLFNFPHPAIKIHAGPCTLGIITTDQTPYFIDYTTPIDIKALDIDFVQNKYAIIGTDGKLYMWNFKSEQPKHVPLPELIKQVSFGNSHYAVLSISGNVYIWGSNRFGELGLPVIELKVPTKLDLPSPISFISMGLDTSAALTRDGKLYMWGSNFNGKILNEDQAPDWVNLKPSGYISNYVPRPIQISIERLVINYVEVSETYTLAVTDDGAVNYWGWFNW